MSGNNSAQLQPRKMFLNADMNFACFSHLRFTPASNKEVFENISNRLLHRVINDFNSSPNQSSSKETSLITGWENKELQRYFS